MRIDGEINLAGAVFSPLTDHYEFALLSLTNHEGATRSLFGVHWQRDMMFVLDIGFFHIFYVA